MAITIFLKICLKYKTTIMSGEENSKWTVIDGSPAFVNKKPPNILIQPNSILVNKWLQAIGICLKIRYTSSILHLTSMENSLLLKSILPSLWTRVQDIVNYNLSVLVNLSYWTKSEICHRLDCMQQIKLSILAAKSCWEFGEYFQWQNVKQ